MNKTVDVNAQSVKKVLGQNKLSKLQQKFGRTNIQKPPFFENWAIYNLLDVGYTERYPSFKGDLTFEEKTTMRVK